MWTAVPYNRYRGKPKREGVLARVRHALDHDPSFVRRWEQLRKAVGGFAALRQDSRVAYEYAKGSMELDDAVRILRDSWRLFHKPTAAPYARAIWTDPSHPMAPRQVAERMKLVMGNKRAPTVQIWRFLRTSYLPNAKRALIGSM